MADVKILTDKQIAGRLKRLQGLGSFAGLGFLVGAAAVLAGVLGFSISMIGAGAAGATLCYAASNAATKAEWHYKNEQTRRSPPEQVTARAQPTQKAAASPSAAANDFNPAAATTLEKDIKPMAPLRLQLKLKP